MKQLESSESSVQSEAAHAGRAPELPMPTAEQMLDAVLALGREIHLEMPERVAVRRFLHILTELFPHRFAAVRVLDPRSFDRAGAYVSRGLLRAGVESEQITLKPSSVTKTQLKQAVVESARIRLAERWDSPFQGVAKGFAVPLVASGELYGVLDVGYPLGTDLSERDEPLILPIANHLSVALRNQKLHRDTTVLRDYQARLIEQANALILGIDRSWRITVCNRALCELTGYEHEELFGRDLRDWLPAEARARLTASFRLAFSGAATDAVELEFVTGSGSRVRAVWSVAPVGGRSGVKAVVAIGQDQTKLLELQSQVIQAEKLATLGQLAAGVVHELNNPLTSITVYAEFLLKKAESAAASGEPVDEGDINKLRHISAGAQRILVFARDLVQYAKPAGTEYELVDVNSVVRQSLSFCEHLFERRDVALSQELDETLPPVHAVPGQLEQVLINLVTNAVHACDERGRVSVATARVGEEGVEIFVADNGSGIAPEDRERVFEPFFSTKANGEGTGLGLSIVRNIVEQHRGRVCVEESDDGGARFVCWLPAGG